MNQQLDKRVLSRLNAQYVFIPPISARQVCEFMSEHLTLPSTFVRGYNDGDSKLYMVHFNNNIVKAFGPIPVESPPSSSSSTAVSDQTFDEDASSDEGESNYEDTDEDKDEKDKEEIYAQENGSKLYYEILEAVQHGSSFM